MRFLLFGSPAHPRGGCAGVAFLIILALSGCRQSGSTDQPVVLELEGDTVRLPPGVRLIEITVRVASHEFEPSTVDARVGDVVRFTARDAGSHAIAFEGARLAGEAHTFLEQTGQLRAPPLLHDGASWIISLADAPVGEYPFRCLTHGAWGRLNVVAAQ